MRQLSVILFFLMLINSSLCGASEFEIDAWAFDRGNMAVFMDQYRNGGPPPVVNGGTSPAEVEYDVPFPVTGKYTFSVLVAMNEVRPYTIYLDGKEIGYACTEKTTRSWDSVDAIWYDAPEFVIEKAGVHTVKLVSNLPAHLVKLKFQSEQTFPEGWTLDRPKAKKLPVIEEQYQGETNLTATVPKPEAIRRAIVDLLETFGDQYPKGNEYLKRLDNMTDPQELAKLQYEAVFAANPVIDFDRLLLIRRNNKGPALGFPANWESNSSLPKSGYDDEIMTLDLRSQDKKLQSFYKPPRDTMISDLDLDFDAGKVMFSAVGDNDRWHIFEVQTDSPLKATQLTRGDSDVDFYDSCYLPDGRIILTCTAAMVGVPCVAGSSHVANLFLFDPRDQCIRQICYDQEHNWCPTMLNDGRMMYTRWEYADTPHSNTRFLFHCNPDGTSQLEYYGSNSYWPTSIFYTRAIPNHPTKVIGVIGGHHDNGRVGELVILDPAISRKEAEGAVQMVPGFGKKVESHVVDGLTRKAWPKFAHPSPVSEKYFFVAAKPTPNSLFGIYFVDIFDNMILVKELPENALLEPIPLKATTRPPVIPDRVDLARDDANIYISNVLDGPGLENIPPGAVKQLRVYTYHFSFQGVGGLYGSVGQDGPWDVRGVLGTVPVEEDGSVHFRAPANLPIAVLPLDKNGQALQLMRSWMTAMPGENLHCNGCHESQNSTPLNTYKIPTAMGKRPAEIKPYNSPNPEGKSLLEQLNVRGFSFHEQVQPVLDQYCISCHNGDAEKTAKTALVNDHPVGTALDGKPFAINLRGDRKVNGWTSSISGNCSYMGWGGNWTVAYDNLQRFVRRPGIESDYALLAPMEFSANTTELVQILKAGHYGVELDSDSWNRLITWIDMNAPFHGNWADATSAEQVARIAKRRVDLAEMYGSVAIDFEEEKPAAKLIPAKVVLSQPVINAESKPLDFKAMSAADAVKLQQASGSGIEKTIDLGDGLVIKLKKIPQYGTLKKSFWISECEITNAQYRKFDAKHDSRHESRMAYQFGRRGYDVNGDELPVVRVNWNKANDFCRWLSEKNSLNVNLPTEQQWEYAAQAGSTSPFWFGDLDTDFAKFANMGDRRLKEFVADTSHNYYTSVLLIANPNPFDDRFPKDERFDDGNFLQTSPGAYECNPFGIYDMHGNVAEWTRSEQNGEKIVKGGSWYERPYRCTVDSRVSYPPYQGVFNVGFRVVVEEH